MCTLSKLTNVTLVDKPSSSVVIFGILDDIKVAVKISSFNCSNDNALENERKLYMYVAKHMIEETPHMLEGLSIGKCTLIQVMAMENLPQEARYRCLDLFQARMITIINKNCLNAIEEEFLHFVVTPQVNGISFAEFLENHKENIVKYNLEIILALQVAQALCVFEKHKFMNNDLHTKNILVITHLKPITIPYSYPFSFKIKT